MGYPRFLKKFFSILIGLIFALFFPLGVFASGGATATPSMGHTMTQVVLQLSMILIATWLGGLGARKLGLPAALGHLFAGMAIGPFALGGLPFLDFKEGLFAALPGPIPVSPVLYVFSTLASIILLFISGLETDLSLFKRYVAKGAVVGVGGVIVSFTVGAVLTAWFLGIPLGSPAVLFMGSLSVASSVGIAASVLSAKRKIDSPEGTTILSAAVVDDILGIILLAVVLGVSSRLGAGGGAADMDVGELLLDVAWIAFRAFGIWLVVTLLGLRFARSIGKALKVLFKDRSQLAIMAFGLAMLLAGFFEEAGLSLVIGAYIMGLSLSNTDLAFLIQGKLGTLKDFLVPIFFAVSGMLLNFHYLVDLRVIGFGLLFALGAVIAKLVGSGGPAFLLGFNGLGALRIGFGMVPRAEVTLIVAGIGVSTGVLKEDLFGVALIMMISTIIIAPPVLNLLLGMPGSGSRQASGQGVWKETVVNFQTREFADLLVARFLSEMEKEGFFVSHLEHDTSIYQMRKDNIFVSLTVDDDGVARFLSDEDNVPLFQTALYESLLSVSDATADLKVRFKPEEMASQIGETKPGTENQSETPVPVKKATFNLGPFLRPAWIVLKLQNNSKIGVITELIDVLDQEGFLEDRVQVLQDVLDREASMTTGMPNGIALPHAKTTGTKQIAVVLGLAPEGIDFQSMDGLPSRIFALIVSPKEGEGHHLQVLSAVSGILKKEENRGRLLQAQDAAEVIKVFTPA